MSNPRNKNLLIIIGVLLLTNIALLVFFLSQKPGKQSTAAVKNERPGIGEMLKNEVGFTDDQIAKYKELKEEQRQTIKPMYDDMRKTKESMFQLLGHPAADSLVNQVTDAIAQKQKALDLQTFSYFRKVRSLCTAEQQPKYDSLILHTFRKMGKSPKQGESKKK
ncbi:MAG TPA: Spy/CpxP family protein refolding chaperone [Chitinophagaceae bacterium]|nr:Spy/CpxP family protein refolding chaperone [Chitinophagaceae bacterium]HUM65821.1 Spy/CpxP family protein refolding chaperone [Chitinophagaceae bacterium]